MLGRENVFYAPLIRAKRQVGESVDETADDPVMRDALRYVTSRIDKELGARAPFIPVAETEYLTARTFPNGDVWAMDLLLPRPLIELTALTNGDGTAITPAEYTLFPRARPPYTKIRLRVDGSTVWLTENNGETQDVIAVQGLWGNRDAYANQWLNSGDTVKNSPNLSSSAMTITVDNAKGRDLYARTPRFSAGQLGRVDSEFFAVLDVDYDTSELYVQRGVLGTTAMQHSTNAPISLFEVDPTIQQAAAIWAAFAYKRRGHFENAEFDVDTGIARRYPKDIPPEVAGILGLEANQAVQPISIRIYKV